MGEGSAISRRIAAEPAIANFFRHFVERSVWLIHHIRVSERRGPGNRSAPRVSRWRQRLRVNQGAIVGRSCRRVLTLISIRRGLGPKWVWGAEMMPKIPSHRLLLRLSPFALALVLGGCDWAVLDPKGPIGDGNATLLIDFGRDHARHRGPDHHRHPWHRLVVPVVQREGVLSAGLGVFRPARAYHLAIRLLTIMLLGGVTWIGAHDLDPAKPLVSKEQEPLNVQVVSLDWKWLFIYPDQHVASVNRLVIPAGTPIRFALTSGSVMTAFFVPQLGSMIYTMNRMRTQLYLMADNPGVFRGLATQIAGDGFADMHFEVEAGSRPRTSTPARPGARRRTSVDARKLYRAVEAERRA